MDNEIKEAEGFSEVFEVSDQELLQAFIRLADFALELVLSGNQKSILQDIFKKAFLLEARVESLASSVSQLLNQNSSLQSRISELDISYNEKLNELLKENNQLSGELKNLKIELESVKQSEEKWRQALKSLEEERDLLLFENSSLKSRVHELEISYADSLSKIATLEKELESLKKIEEEKPKKKSMQKR